MVGQTRGMDSTSIWDQQRVEDDGLLQSSQQELRGSDCEPLRDGVGQATRGRELRKKNFEVGITLALGDLAREDGDFRRAHAVC